jgi:hypothetical protein
LVDRFDDPLVDRLNRQRVGQRTGPEMGCVRLDNALHGVAQGDDVVGARLVAAENIILCVLVIIRIEQPVDAARLPRVLHQGLEGRAHRRVAAE